MKKFLKHNNKILKEILIFAIFIAIAFIVVRSIGYTFGSTDSDFHLQHARLIDYMRENFYLTHDLTPSMLMNLGGTQSYSTLFYYGYLNPIILFSYLVPFISTMDYLTIVSYFIILLSFIGMRFLLKTLKTNDSIAIFLSICYALSMPIFFHLGMHLMFIYFYPWMPISLWAMIYLIRTKKMWFFTICIALIFFFNFYFALVIGFTQLLLFIAYYLFYEDKRKQPLRQVLPRYIFSYFIGLLMGLVTFLPQALSIMDGSRGYMNFTYPLLSFEHVKNVAFSAYSSGLGILAYFTIIYGIINFKKDKFTFLLSVVMAFVLIIMPFTTLLNYFMYNHFKVLIYTTPIYMIMFARIFSQDFNKNKVLISLGFTIVILILINHKLTDLSVAWVYFIALIQILFIIYYTFKYKHRYLIALLCGVVIAFANAFSASNIIKATDFQEKIIVNKNGIEKPNFEEMLNDGFYRKSNSTQNFVESFDQFDPKIYVSVPNSKWYKFYEDLILIPYSKLERQLNPSLFKNYAFADFFGVESYKSLEDSKESVNYTGKVKPFIYGVKDKDIYNYQSLLNIDKADRIFALNQGVFVDDNTQDFIFDHLKKNDVYKENKIKNPKFTVDIPREYQQDGLFIIDAHLANKKVSNINMYINGEIMAKFASKSLFTVERRDAHIYFPASANTKTLEFNYTQAKPEYSDFKIQFIPMSELKKKNYDAIKTTNNKVELNQKYEFDLNMKENGYLMTTITYDDGFNIKDNGKEIEKTVMDGYFLGAKLDKGNHHISIEYQMKGFQVGAISTVIGFLILGFIMVKEINWLNRPFFRFVLVGVFNTINYFIVYTILLTTLPYLFAHVSAFLFSALVSYFLTSLYTFNTKPTWKTLAAFPLTFLPNLIFSSFGTIALVELNLLQKDIASLVMMILIIPITFIINRIIFVRKKHQFKNDENNEKI